MADFVINERRRETRVAAPTDPVVQVPGARVLETVDKSRHGLRCRLAGPVRPGRTMSLRVAAGASTAVVTALVVRCEVCRLTRAGVQYEAAWTVQVPWSP
jgi:hypothetical protein